MFEFSSDGDDGVITHDDRLRGMVIKQGDMVSFVADNLNEQIKLSSPSQSGNVILEFAYSNNPELGVGIPISQYMYFSGFFKANSMERYQAELRGQCTCVNISDGSSRWLHFVACNDIESCFILFDIILSLAANLLELHD